jgi:hypothetical protein
MYTYVSIGGIPTYVLEYHTTYHASTPNLVHYSDVWRSGDARMLNMRTNTSK